MTDLAFESASKLAAAIRGKRIGSRELLALYLQRVERFNPALNAIVTLDAERAFTRAEAADAALARGEPWGALHGVPITIKDSFETAGLRTTSGAPELATHVPANNAIAVQRLVAAGAVVFGKTNLPTFAMDLQSYNPVFGCTNNPWDTTRTPGGSSGGAAAALAAGLTGLELGSDIGGSIRTPAHFCGVYGHKPSFGIVPMQGHIPGPPGLLSETDIGVGGPMARSADDLALALDLLAGPTDERATAWRLQLPAPRHESLRDFRVAAWLDDPACAVDSEVLVRHQALVQVLREAGAVVNERARPAFGFAEARDLYLQLLYAATSPGLPGEQWLGLAQAADRLPPAVDDATSRFARSATQRHRDWLVAHERREHMRAAWARFFKDHDVLLCPATPSAAIAHDPSEPMAKRVFQVNGSARPYTDQLAWAGLIGMALLPSTVAPAGRTGAGLPVGVQIVGPYLEDRTTIRFAQLLAEAAGGFERPPGY
ncbi:MAG: amidase [Burkholderiales bacterium]|nr:amidase [Burkholderiales bacterium]